MTAPYDGWVFLYVTASLLFPCHHHQFVLVSRRYAVLRFNQYFKTKPAVMALQIPE